VTEEFSFRRAPQFVVEIDRKDGTTLVERNSMGSDQLHSFLLVQRRYHDVVEIRVYELRSQLIGITLQDHDERDIIW